MFSSSWELIISNKLLQKICRGKFAAQKFLGKFGEIRAKYSSHLQKFACSYTYVSIDGFSDWSGASVRLAEQEKSSCH